MRIVKKTYKVFKFSELEKETQEKVIEKLYNINVEYDWWADDCIYEEIAEKYGLGIDMSEICFDLDRSNFCYFETYNHGQKDNYTKGIFIDNYSKFIKKAGLKENKALKENDFYIDHKHYGGGDGKNYIEGDNLTEKELEKLETCLESFTEEILSQLKRNYNYLTSEKSIIDTIEANEYDFLENGEMF